jgi:hypothetical protein
MKIGDGPGVDRDECVLFGLDTAAGTIRIPDQQPKAFRLGAHTHLRHPFTRQIRMPSAAAAGRIARRRQREHQTGHADIVAAEEPVDVVPGLLRRGSQDLVKLSASFAAAARSSHRLSACAQSRASSQPMSINGS